MINSILIFFEFIIFLNLVKSNFIFYNNSINYYYKENEQNDNSKYIFYNIYSF